MTYKASEIDAAALAMMCQPDPLHFGVRVLNRVAELLREKKAAALPAPVPAPVKAAPAPKPPNKVEERKARPGIKSRPGREMVEFEGARITRTQAARIVRLRGWAKSANPPRSGEGAKGKPGAPVERPAASNSPPAAPLPRPSRAGQDSKPGDGRPRGGKFAEPKAPPRQVLRAQSMAAARQIGSARRELTPAEKQKWRDDQAAKAPPPAKATFVIDEATGKRRLSAAIDGAHVSLSSPARPNDWKLGPAKRIED